MLQKTENPLRRLIFPCWNDYIDTPQFYNQRLKIYPTPTGPKIAEVVTFSAPKFNPYGIKRDKAPKLDGYADFKAEVDAYIYEKYIGLVDEYTFSGVDEEQPTERSSQLPALNRAKKRAFDLMACNPDCNMFVTLTLDPEKVSRTNWREIVPKLNVWLDNMVRRKGLKYVLVPEYHKDGKSIHFHGMMNEEALTLVNSGKRHNGRVVYNVTDWKLGFTTAKRIKGGYADHIAVSKYVFKYMTKAAEELRKNPEKDIKIGGRFFLHGGELAEPLFEYASADYSSVRGYEMSITDTLKCKVEGFI